MVNPDSTGGKDMSSATFQAIYDGEALRGHKIDVEQLAPALLALGEMVREANATINGGRSKVKLLVTADRESQCFDIGLELIQTIYQQIQTVLGAEGVKNAKELLEWLGITAGTGLGYLAYMKLKKGRKIVDVKQITDEDKRGLLAIKFDGAVEHVEIHHHVYDLSENRKILAATSGALAPLKVGGIKSLEFRSKDDVSVKYNKEEATEIEASCSNDDVEESYDPQEITAHLSIYSSVFDEGAEHWRFNYGGDHISANISETNIARDALDLGSVGAGDTYKVRLEITEYRTATGQHRKKYKILEVLDFIPSAHQHSLFNSRSENDGEG